MAGICTADPAPTGWVVDNGVGTGRLGGTFATRMALFPNRLVHVMVIAVVGEIGGR